MNCPTCGRYCDPDLYTGYDGDEMCPACRETRCYDCGREYLEADGRCPHCVNEGLTEAQLACGYCLYGPPAICTCGTCEPQAGDANPQVGEQ